MTPAQFYRRLIEEVGLNQVEAGKFFNAAGRTSRNWAAKGAPPAVEMVLRIMVARGISVAMVDRIMNRKPTQTTK